jgi:hypothetical protein
MEIMVKLRYVHSLSPPMNLRWPAEYLTLLFTILILFFVTLVHPLFLLCLALALGAVSPHGCKRAAADVALWLSQKVAKSVAASILM